MLRVSLRYVVFTCAIHLSRTLSGNLPPLSPCMIATNRRHYAFTVPGLVAVLDLGPAPSDWYSRYRRKPFIRVIEKPRVACFWGAIRSLRVIRPQTADARLLLLTGSAKSRRLCRPARARGRDHRHPRTRNGELFSDRVRGRTGFTFHTTMKPKRAVSLISRANSLEGTPPEGSGDVTAEVGGWQYESTMLGKANWLSPASTRSRRSAFGSNWIPPPSPRSPGRPPEALHRQRDWGDSAGAPAPVPVTDFRDRRRRPPGGAAHP